MGTNEIVHLSAYGARTGNKGTRVADSAIPWYPVYILFAGNACKCAGTYKGKSKKGVYSARDSDLYAAASLLERWSYLCSLSFSLLAAA